MKIKHDKIDERLKELGWSRYRLAQEMGKYPQAVYGILASGEFKTAATMQSFSQALGLNNSDIAEL